MLIIVSQQTPFVSRDTNISTLLKLIHDLFGSLIISKHWHQDCGCGQYQVDFDHTMYILKAIPS